MVDSPSVLVLVLSDADADTDADTNSVLTDDPRLPLSVGLLNPEVTGVLASAAVFEVAVAVSVAEDNAADELDVLARARDRDRDDDDSVPACALDWVREDVNPDDADADVDEIEFEGVLELDLIVEVVNRDFDEEEGEGVDVSAMDKDEILEEDVNTATDADEDLVKERDEERDEESLVVEAGADVARGSSVDEVVSDPAPASVLARLVEVTAPTNQIRQPVPSTRRNSWRHSRLRSGMGLIIRCGRKDRKGCKERKERRSYEQVNDCIKPTRILASI